MCFDQRDNFGEFGRVGKGMIDGREVVGDESVEQAWFECNIVHVSEVVEGCHWNGKRSEPPCRRATVTEVFCCVSAYRAVGFGF